MLLLGGICGAGVMILAYNTSVYFSSDESCMMCHVHPHVESSWKLSKHVNNGSGVKVHCVDCHLPPKHDTWNHYTAKAKLGLKDVWSFMTKDSADFDWNVKSELEHAVKYIPNESCKECHQNLFPEGITNDGITAHLYYDENEKICKKCHTPLSNAVYNQVSSGNDINQPAPKRKSFVPIVAAILICCLIAGGIGGYFYYISRVKQGCREATRQIFTYAKNMDFSDVAPSDLPEPLKSEPNVRELVKQQLKTYIGDSELGSLVDVDSIDVTTLCDEMVDQASYKITDVSATYNSCTVTVTTKNIDFYSLPETIYDEIKSQITDGNSSLWTSIKNSISSLLGGSSQTAIEKIDISENLKNWYKETKKNGPTRKTTGKIVFGIKDGKWTLISFDERLIYGYYGLRPLQ